MAPYTPIGTLTFVGTESHAPAISFAQFCQEELNTYNLHFSSYIFHFYIIVLFIFNCHERKKGPMLTLGQILLQPRAPLYQQRQSQKQQLLQLRTQLKLLLRVQRRVSKHLEFLKANTLKSKHFCNQISYIYD